MGEKQAVLRDFRAHVSSGKVSFFQRYGMDFVMGRREGIYLWDIESGKRLINLHCNGGVFNLGHRHPVIRAALHEALGQYDIGNHHLLSAARARAARLLAHLMPGSLDYVVFGVGGGEAVDLAIKVARGYTGRRKIVSARGGYHGHTGYALAAGDEKYRAPFGPPLPGFVQIPFGDAEALAAALDRDTAAVILETIPATLGMPIPSAAYMRAVRRLCDERGVLLILDEVQAGLGRTGRLWAFSHYDIMPDMVVLGKGLSGGIYPIAATVLRRPLERVFHPDPFVHVSTFGGAELGCVVMEKVLEISSDPDFLAHVNRMAALIAQRVEELLQRHAGFLTGFRQKGLMMGLEMAHEDAGPLLTKTAYDNGLLMVYANNDPRVAQFLPPLVIEPRHLDEMFPRLDRALAQARRLLPLLKLKKRVSRIFSRKGKR